MSKEASAAKTPDLSLYEQFFTRPQEVRAKKLTKDKEYDIVLNGVAEKATGHKGDWDVYVLKRNGQILRNEPYSDEIFKDKFGKKDSQGNLVFDKSAKETEE